MNQKKRLLSDIEKLCLLNRLGKIKNIHKYNRTNYHQQSYTTSKKKNPKSFYLQKTNQSSFMPFPIKLFKKERNINSVSPNSYRNNSNIEINNHNNSFDFIQRRQNNFDRKKINFDINLQRKNYSKINELKNSLGNPKYARNMMINRDIRHNRAISISTIQNSIKDDLYRMNHSYENKNKMRYILNSKKKNARSISFNNLGTNELNNIHRLNNSLEIETNRSYINNQYQANLNNLREQENLITNDKNDEFGDMDKMVSYNINLDNLTYIEGRLNDIILALSTNNNTFDINAKNECFQFLKYYKRSSLFNKFPLFFGTSRSQLIIKSAFNLHLFIVIITYSLSSNPVMMNKIINLLRKIYYLLKTNLFLIIYQIEITNEELNGDIHFQTCHYFFEKIGLNVINENSRINLINNNCVSIVNDIKIILNLFQIINNKHYYDLRNLFLNISIISEQEIYNYFYTSLAIDDNSNNNNINYNVINNNPEIKLKEKDEDEKFIDNIIFSYKLNKAIPPFLTYKSKKKFTIILDLEDTLLNIKLTDTGKLILNLRPGLIQFLSGIKPYYEIISFSKFSKSYSTTIINYIQQGRKLFDVNLYREHCTLIGRKFIKDISLIGRDMKKIIMVDDLPENLEKFQANGILILPYEGEEQINDRVLYELKKMLILIYKLGYDDIRLAIKQFKDDIYEKITLGIN